MLNTTQFENRRKGIGGSDVAAIFGISKWKTAYDVYCDKIGETKVSEETPQQKWGSHIENALIQLYEKEFGQSVFVSEETLIHQDNPFIIGNLDGFIEEENAVLEIKTALRGDGWGSPETDQMPTEYLLQVAHYCILTNADLGYVYVSIAGAYPVRYVYHRNNELEKVIIEKEKSFWQDNVLQEVPPELTSVRDVESFYGVIDEPIEANDIQYDLVVDLEDIKYELKELKKKEEDLKQQLLKSLEGHNVLVKNGKQLLTWKEQTSKRLDTTLIKKELPEIYSKYAKESTCRVLRIKGV